MKVFGEDSGLGEHELRRRAKIIDYALLYGKTAFTLAKAYRELPRPCAVWAVQLLQLTLARLRWSVASGRRVCRS